MIFKYRHATGAAAFIVFVLILLASAKEAAADIYLSGGLMVDIGKHTDIPYKGVLGDPTRKKEEISIINAGFLGTLDIGGGPGAFGVHMGNALTGIGSVNSTNKGQLDWVELFLLTQLSYNLPYDWTFISPALKPATKILQGIQPWIGVGPWMNKAIVKDVAKTEKAYETVPDLMDMGFGVTIGFKINFWTHLAKSSNFQKKMMGITYIVVDFTYLTSLTPDDENIATDNGGAISRTDFIIRVGSGLRIETGGKKK